MGTYVHISDCAAKNNPSFGKKSLWRRDAVNDRDAETRSAAGRSRARRRAGAESLDASDASKCSRRVGRANAAGRGRAREGQITHCRATDFSLPSRQATRRVDKSTPRAPPDGGSNNGPPPSGFGVGLLRAHELALALLVRDSNPRQPGYEPGALSTELTGGGGRKRHLPNSCTEHAIANPWREPSRAAASGAIHPCLKLHQKTPAGVEPA